MSTHNNQPSGVPAEDNLMHRTHTNLTDTLDFHSDVKTPVNEKCTTTAIDIPSTLDEKDEISSDCHEPEHVKKVSKLGLFYRRHLPWFQ